MSSQAKITIVIPVRNRAALVERTLESVKAQTIRPLKVILVDNGSTDGTWPLLQRWADANRADDFSVITLRELAPGAAAARNAGLAHVGSEWTMFFDSDDEMLPTHAERALACAEANPGASIIGWDVTLRTLSGRDCIKPFVVHDALYGCVMHGTMATQRYMARTSLLLRAGGWRPDVMAWNDIELGARLLGLSPIMAKAEGKPTVIVHSTRDSITGTDFSHHADDLDHALDCIEASTGATTLVAIKRAILAGLCRREGNAEIAHRLMEKVRAMRLAAPDRMLCAAASAITAAGLRGASMLYKLCIRKP